jgi:hypothetical protein
MPLIPFYNPLSFQDIATIFTQPITTITINRYYRGGTIVSDNLANQQVPKTGALSVSDFYGDARGRIFVNLVIASDTFNFDVYANRTNAYVPGLTDISVTVNPGVYVGSNVAASPAMSVPNSFTVGDTVYITNYGSIYGRGGQGGQGVVVIQTYNGSSFSNVVLTANTSYTLPAGTVSGKIWAIGAGGGGAGSTAADGTSGGAGGAGGLSYIAF